MREQIKAEVFKLTSADGSYTWVAQIYHAADDTIIYKSGNQSEMEAAIARAVAYANHNDLDLEW